MKIQLDFRSDAKNIFLLKNKQNSIPLPKNSIKFPLNHHQKLQKKNNFISNFFPSNIFSVAGKFIRKLQHQITTTTTSNPSRLENEMSEKRQRKKTHFPSFRNEFHEIFSKKLKFKNERESSPS